MVVYDKVEQNRLREEIKQAILKAFKVYQENIKEINSYGCNEEEHKEGFLDECKTVLYPDLCSRCHTNPKGQDKTGWCETCINEDVNQR